MAFALHSQLSLQTLQGKHNTILPQCIRGWKCEGTFARVCFIHFKSNQGSCKSCMFPSVFPSVCFMNVNMMGSQTNQHKGWLFIWIMLSAWAMCTEIIHFNLYIYLYIIGLWCVTHYYTHYRVIEFASN